MIRIDSKRCINCGRCAEDCNSGVFRITAGHPAVAHEDRCNYCSHCLAVCPAAAIVHQGLDGVQPPRVRKGLLQAPAYREIVMSRRSVRRYKPDPVPREVVQQILDLARYSPTASNAQNVHFTVVSRRSLLDEVSGRLFTFGDRVYRFYTQGPVQRLRRLARGLEAVKSLDRYTENWPYYREQVEKGTDLLFHHAPVLLLLHAPKGQGLSRDNCLIAAANIDNYAHALGLGACFIGLLVTAMQMDRSLPKKFGIPPAHRVYAALTLGYPAFPHPYHPVRKGPAVQWLSETP